MVQLMSIIGVHSTLHCIFTFLIFTKRCSKLFKPSKDTDMKKLFIFLTLVCIAATALAQNASNCGGKKSATEKKSVKIGIVLYSNDAETVWNAFRLANYSLGEGDSVSVFLLGKGVEAQKISTKDFDVTGQMNDFAASGGKILACGTCLRLRNQEGSKLCPVSSLSDLYAIIKASDKVLTF
jgi:uncharacterized protein involved in oxidation of intracellular sulfur